MNNRDWTGKKHSTFSTLGASNHSDYERADRDFYATHPSAIEGLLKYIILQREIWENATGNGHLAQKLTEKGYDVFCTDIIKRDYPLEQLDFLKYGMGKWGDILADRDIVTNPPYKNVQEWAEKAIQLLGTYSKLCLFLKITFLEGQKRKKFFEKYPPKYVLVFSKRIPVARNGDPKMFNKSSAACYAWFVWEKFFKGDPTIKWI